MHEIVKNFSGFWLLLFDHDGLVQTQEGREISILPQVELGPNDHRKDASHFTL